MLKIIGLFPGLSKKIIFTKLENPNCPKIGKIPLNGSPEGLVNTRM